MSSILEALKKLEEEKAVRRGGMGNIAGKVTSGGRRTRQRPAWIAPAAMAAVAAVAVLATYAAMGGFSSHRNEEVRVKSIDAPPQQPVTSTPQPSPAKGAAPTAAEVFPAPGKRAPAASAPVANPALLPPRENTSENPPIARHAAAEAPPLPALSVTGIAWQKDNASRVAVVSGMSVVEGAVIEGALVKEILPDRVKFSFDKREFELLLGASPQ